MKQKISSILSLLFVCLVIHAQYTPNTKWPYLYEDFQEGSVMYANNQKSTGLFNIHLFGSLLHFLKEDTIYQMNDNGITSLEIGLDRYIYLNKTPMKLIEQKENTLLVMYTSGNFEAMLAGSGGGAYGSNSNVQATKNLSSLEISGLDNPKHRLLLQEKNEGKDIPITNTYYLVINNELVVANRKEIERKLTKEQQVEWKQFLKENKIKWKDETSLINLLNFFTKYTD